MICNVNEEQDEMKFDGPLFFGESLKINSDQKSSTTAQKPAASPQIMSGLGKQLPCCRACKRSLRDVKENNRMEQNKQI